MRGIFGSGYKRPRGHGGELRPPERRPVLAARFPLSAAWLEFSAGANFDGPADSAAARRFAACPVPRIGASVAGRSRAAQVSALVEFSVADTGIGIEEGKQELLFKPFSQTDSSITRQFGGTGLGLSIVRSLAQKMGGDVGVESTPGQGSRFWFRIKAELVDETLDRHNSARVNEEMAISSEQLKGHVLVVEDNPTNQIVMLALLNKLGLTCRTAPDGEAGVNAVQEDATIDLVLMDIQMPIMDGREATRQIRAWEHAAQKKHLPIIALTADAFDKDRQRSLDSGMDDFLTKPVSTDKLILVLRRWLQATKA